jgi:HEAT repeat protein
VDQEPSLHAQDAAERAAACAVLGAGRHRWPRGTSAALVALARDDSDPRVRSAALTAVVRRGTARDAARAWSAAVRDPAGAVRRRAVELATESRAQADDATLLELLDDRDDLVAEGAAFALGEREREPSSPIIVTRLATCATTHRDPLVREAAVAALGALADPAGLDAVLAACADKPAIRRRAVLALAAFSDARVEAALREALDDRDWQVRQAAEDLLGIDPHERT